MEKVLLYLLGLQVHAHYLQEEIEVHHLQVLHTII